MGTNHHQPALSYASDVICGHSSSTSEIRRDGRPDSGKNAAGFIEISEIEDLVFLSEERYCRRF